MGTAALGPVPGARERHRLRLWTSPLACRLVSSASCRPSLPSAPRRVRGHARSSFWSASVSEKSRLEYAATCACRAVVRPPELAPNHSHARDFTGCRQFLQETSPTALELRHQHPDQQIFAPPAAVASRDAHPGACVIFALQASPSLESGRPIRPRRAPLPPPPNHDRAICPSPAAPPRRRRHAKGGGLRLKGWLPSAPQPRAAREDDRTPPPRAPR